MKIVDSSPNALVQMIATTISGFRSPSTAKNVIEASIETSYLNCFRRFFYLARTASDSKIPRPTYALNYADYRYDVRFRGAQTSIAA